MRLIIPSLLIVFLAGPAFAQETCQQQLDQLTQQWNAIGLPTPSKPGQALVTGRYRHQHSGGEVTFMLNQLRSAGHQCKAGQEHESMLRMDVVRAYLNLPEVAHPASHHYRRD